MTQERRSVVAPSRFARLTALYTVAAAAALGVAALVRPPPGGWRQPTTRAPLGLGVAALVGPPPGVWRQPQLWLLIGLTLAVELLPIRLPRHTSTDIIT